MRRLARAFTVGDPWLGALALAVCAYYAATRGIYQGKASGDGYFGFMYLPSIVYHHTIDLAQTVPYWAKILGTEKTGHVANACPIGPVAFWMPFYLLARALEWAAGLVAHVAPEGAQRGQTVFDFWMAGLGSLLAGLAGVAATYRLIARRISVGAARFASIAVVAATPLCWYFVTQPLYQHACAFFLVALLVERWDAWRGAMTLGRWAWLGALGGAAMTMRVQEAIFLLLPGLDAAALAIAGLRARQWDRVVRAISGGLILSFTALLVFAPQLIAWYWFFGKIRTPQPPGHMRWSDPALVATLFSTRGGLLCWTPIYYFVLPGLICLRKRAGGLAWRIGLLLIIDIWVNAAAWDHFGSWTYGARRFTDAGVAFAVGLAGMWAWAAARPRRTARILLIGFLSFTIALNVLLMESLRAGKIKSSGSRAYPASTWVKWLNGPPWLGKIFDTVGYPFCQPAGWIYAATYRVSPRVFEGVVGNYVMERDSRIHSVVNTPGFEFSDPELFVVENTGTRVRMLIPMFAREPVRARLTGDFRGPVTATWNGAAMKVVPSPGAVTFDVAVEQVHSRSRMNEVVLTLPAGARPKRFELQSTSTWW